MADVQGILSSEEIAQVIRRLQELDRSRGAPLSCAVCANTRWTVQARTLMLNSSVSIAGLLGFDPAQCFVVVTCNNCSHTLLFEALGMGVRPPTQPRNALAGFPTTGLGGGNG